MPTYVYETTGKNPRRFEVRQSMNDAPLTHDPDTGETVLRVISGGFGIMEKGKAASRAVAPAPTRQGHCCGGGCGCGH